ncbi:MAG: class I SAM-dependent methyltransferase [Ktedonobacteraceae bacterium]
MSYAAYNDIAEWYDSYLSENAIYQEMLLPSLLDLTGDIQGQIVCDLACGQGWITRELARCGARVTGVDLSDQLLEIARRYEKQEPLGISYQQGDAQHADLLAGRTFDGCVCSYSLVDIPDLTATFATMRRLLKTDGWLVFAITHPCFEAPNAQWVVLDDGKVARAISNYFREGFWKSESGGVRSRVGSQHRVLSTYLNTLLASGFALERVLEPVATG